MQKRLALAFILVIALLGVAAPLSAQEASAQPAASEIGKWSIITAGFALAIAAAFGALGQSRGLSAAAEAVARNPSANNDIRFLFILGMVLIESLVIYVLLVALILFFLYPFGGAPPA